MSFDTKLARAAAIGQTVLDACDEIDSLRAQVKRLEDELAKAMKVGEGSAKRFWTLRTGSIRRIHSGTELFSWTIRGKSRRFTAPTSFGLSLRASGLVQRECRLSSPTVSPLFAKHC